MAAFYLIFLSHGKNATALMVMIITQTLLEY